MALQKEEEESSVSSMDPPPPLCSGNSTSSLLRNNSCSRLNAGAPEYVPRTTTNHHHHLVMHTAAAFSTSPLFHVPPFEVCFVGNHNNNLEQEPQLMMPDPPAPSSSSSSSDNHHHHHHRNNRVNNKREASSSFNKNALSDDVHHKILNQVEYYFSDANLATTDHLIRYISKDPDGYVPISIVASFKKIKSLVSSHHQLATVLRNSSKLVVSDDGMKVRRQHPLTESDMEDLQSRIIIAENLPEDHSYQNLRRVFSAVGSVKTIRTCQPQISNVGASATSRSSKLENMLFCNKLHAFVEYETVEIAEKAIIALNDARNWRSGLRVRLLLKRTSKSTQARGRKLGVEGDGNAEEDDLSTSELLSDKHLEDHSQATDTTSHEHTAEDSIHDKESGARRGRGHGRGRGKGRGRGQQYNNCGSHIGTPPASNSIHNEQSIATKQPPGPRMPDGTRGFTIGRGKPLVS